MTDNPTAQEIAERIVGGLVRDVWIQPESRKEVACRIAAEIEPHLARHTRLVEAAREVKEQLESFAEIGAKNDDPVEALFALKILTDALEGE